MYQSNLNKFKGHKIFPTIQLKLSNQYFKREIGV